MSLLASEPVVDSQDSKILAAEEVNKLKKVCIPTLSSLTFIDFVKGTTSSYFKTRSYAEKLCSGTTIWDTALFLSKVNVSHKKKSLNRHRSKKMLQTAGLTLHGVLVCVWPCEQDE